MSHLAISLLGSFRVTLDDAPLTSFTTDKVRALLAFLAVEANRPHRREALIDLLWPDRPPVVARNNLRQALYRLRQTLANTQVPAPHLLVTAKEVQLDPGSDYWLDVAEFETCLSTGRTHHPSGQTLCPDCLARLETANTLYQGDFLAGFSLPHCPSFEWWQLLTQEAYHRQALEALALLVNTYEVQQDYGRVSRYASRQIELEPWRESAYRRCMRALALSGQRDKALRQYDICRKQLAREMGVEPSAETTRLYQQIRARALPGIRQASTEPALSSAGPTGSRVATAGPFDRFVGRTAELALLNRHLTEALSGRGQVLFIAGEAGSGKTLLLREFTRQALEAHPRLLVAGDRCDGRLGSGQPYQPFVGLLAALSGAGELHRPTPDEVIERQARRLADAFPSVTQALIENGPALVGTLIPAQLLARRLAGPDLAGRALQAELQTLLQARAVGNDPNLATSPDLPVIDQAALFEQVTQMLLALTGQRPLVLILDDLHWADEGSIHMLFHLGRRLAKTPLLMVGAYRPEQVVPGHTLSSVLHELQARYGEIGLDLARADGRQFLGAVLDSQPNRLDDGFRETLYQHTEGHALFTTELLRGMVARSELVQDASGCWVTGTELNWDQLPARVEAVIAERVARLPEKCRKFLAAASVQGETFILEVVARALDCRPAQALELLSRLQSDRHDLVRALSVEVLTVSHSDYAHSQTLSCYHFRHFLFQQYVYQSLDPVTRNWLHRVTAEGLEALANLQVGEPDPWEASPARLAWHFKQAGQAARAVGYLLQAGQAAYRLSANVEAIAYLQQGLTLLEDIPDTPQRTRQELGLQLALGQALMENQGYGMPAVKQTFDRAWTLYRQVGETPQLFVIFFSLITFYMVRGQLRTALELSEQFLGQAKQGSDRAGLPVARRLLGVTQLWRGQLAQARLHLEESIALYNSELPQALVLTEGQSSAALAMVDSAYTLWLLGYPDQAQQWAEAARHQAEAESQPLTSVYVLFVSALIYDALRDWPNSRTLAEATIALATEHGLVFWWAGGVIIREAMRLRQGQTDPEIVAEMRKNLTIFQATGAIVGLPYMLSLLAEALGRLEQPAEGLSLLAQAQAVVAETENRTWDAELSRLQGELRLKAEGRKLTEESPEVAAEACFQQAIAIAQQQEARSWELRATVRLARLWQAQGKKEEARQMLVKIYNWFTEGFDTADLAEAKMLLAELSGNSRQ
ncbi:MAG: AAA family ATPase [Anaerolineae bacterium]|nr:AAA family ATPase [Anaerolineae bacterium]